MEERRTYIAEFMTQRRLLRIKERQAFALMDEDRDDLHKIVQSFGEENWRNRLIFFFFFFFVVAISKLDKNKSLISSRWRRLSIQFNLLNKQFQFVKMKLTSLLPRPRVFAEPKELSVPSYILQGLNRRNGISSIPSHAFSAARERHILSSPMSLYVTEINIFAY